MSARAVAEDVGRRGLGCFIIEAEHLDRVRVQADRVERIELPDGTSRLLVEHSNSYVRTGLRNSLLREFSTSGTQVGFIGVGSSTSAVTENTRFLNGATAGTPNATGTLGNVVIKALNPAPVISAITDGATQTALAGATFTNADFPGGVFPVAKVGLTLASTDTDGGLVDVIGGSGGASPYNRTFVLDLSAAGTFSYTAQILVTAVAL